MNSKIYSIGFYILLIINLAMVVIFLARPKDRFHRKGMKHEISKELSFTDKQQIIFDEMVSSHRKAIRDLDKKEKERMKLFFNQLSLDPNDYKDSLLHQIGQLKEDKIMLTFNHFKAVKEICNEEQLNNFDEVIFKIIPRITDSRRNRRPGKGGGAK